MKTKEQIEEKIKKLENDKKKKIYLEEFEMRSKIKILKWVLKD